MSLVARLALVALVVALGWLLPALFFDDAYITFRYAAHLAAGEGFSYNPPERLLGATTPLFTLLLALSARAGWDIESAALALGVAGQALLCVALFGTVRRLLPSPRGLEPASTLVAATIGGALAAFHPHLAFTAMGGMETSLYCAFVLLVLSAAADGRGIETGCWLGLGLLTRPDAVLLAIPAGWLLHQRAGDRRRAVVGLARAAAAAALLFLPWALFASLYFGSPIPHSIAAKRLIHPYGPLAVLAEFGRFLADDLPLLVLTPAALAGLWILWRVPLARALALFVLLYLAAYAASGITPFPWYVNPVIAPVIGLAIAGGFHLSGTAAWRRVASALAASGLILFMVFQLSAQTPALREAWEEWEGAYEIAGRWILHDSKPGDRVYVGEVGVIGYLLPGRVVLDSSGINTRDVHELRQGRPEEDPEWSRQVVRRLQPDYIATAAAYLHIRTLAGEAWFQALYEPVTPPLLAGSGQVIFRKRRP